MIVAGYAYRLHEEYYEEGGLDHVPDSKYGCWLKTGANC